MTTTTTKNGKRYALITIRANDGGTLEPGQYWVEMPTSYDPETVTGVDIECDGMMRALADWEAEDLGLLTA
jgi:hypothetical protein